MGGKFEINCQATFFIKCAIARPGPRDRSTQVRYYQKFYEKPLYNIRKDKENPPLEGEGEGWGEKMMGHNKAVKKKSEDATGYPHPDPLPQGRGRDNF